MPNTTPVYKSVGLYVKRMLYFYFFLLLRFMFIVTE